ncbi:MAG: hypothetical protein Q4A09_09115 [Capnocytophaga felis]|nr:hypothetical protein [Capnocytophaga felis]
MTRKERLHQRNERVRNLFQELSAKNPKWRIDAVISEVAVRMFLAPRTVEAIISYEGVYNDTPQDTQKRQLRFF